MSRENATITADVIGVNIIEPGTGHLGIEGAAPIVVLTPEQRSLLKKVLEKVLSALYAVEVVVEVGPDGTVRVFGRIRTP